MKEKPLKHQGHWSLVQHDMENFKMFLDISLSLIRLTDLNSYAV